MLKWIVAHNSFSMPEVVFFLRFGGNGNRLVGNIVFVL